MLDSNITIESNGDVKNSKYFRRFSFEDSFAVLNRNSEDCCWSVVKIEDSGTGRPRLFGLKKRDDKTCLYDRSIRIRWKIL
jgi:hypothetical protein